MTDIINLSKGASINLSKDAPSLTKILFGLGWKNNDTDTGADFDLDSTVFLLGTDDKMISAAHIVFYNQLTFLDDVIVHSEDDLTGGDTADGGDNETVAIDLNRVPTDVAKIVFVCTIHKADERKQNFGQVKDAYIRLVDQANGKEIARYDLGEDFGVETAVVFAELYRHNGDWKFKAIGTGSHDGLKTYVNKYGFSAKE